MTEDQPGDHVDDGLDEATQQAVARLLADARHTGPVPVDVATRLDGVLADLQADRVESPSPRRSAVVVPIASRRRRRLATGLVAAAAVVAVGVALPSLTGAGSAPDSAPPAVPAPPPGSSDSGETLMRDGGASGDSSEPTAGAPEAQSGQSGPLVAPPTVSPDRFRRDAVAARRQAVADSTAPTTGCGVLPPGDVVPVLYEGRTGYLVLAPPAGDRQRAALYLCPAGELVRRVQIPAP